jgi:hypothetical protein
MPARHSAVTPVMQGRRIDFDQGQLIDSDQHIEKHTVD